MRLPFIIGIISVNLLFFTGFSFSQTGESIFSDAGFDTVNIRAILMKQINQIREKQQEEKTQFKENLPDSVIQETGIIWKYFALIEAALLAALAIMWRRRRALNKSEEKQALKQNIGLLRQEKIGHGDNPLLRKLRKNLQHEPKNIQTGGSMISKNAKKLSISKGELLLAEKLRLMQR